MIRAALLFYRKLRRNLEEMGFEVNPYDPCVANRDVNGAQCTVVWRGDDLKVSHRDESVVTYFASELAKQNCDKIKIKQGKVFDYLGMDLDFRLVPGVLIISMIKYLQEVLKEWPEELKGHRLNPHGDNLFTVRADGEQELLSEEMASQFHRTTAQLLFLCLRARPDIQTAVSFFTTRGREPDMDDWKKLRHCLLYLKGTLHMKRYISADGMTNIMWWVDGLYGIHRDSKGDTGAMMFMGRGAIVNVSRKHKLNVGSSTESELVSIADILGVMMWCTYFMEAQGYTIDNNLLYQDNKSTILLAENGRMSAGKASRHIHNRYFLITDKIEKGDVTVEHRGTKEMWANGNTKPLQGAGFRTFRSRAMGIPENYNDDAEQDRTHPLLLPKPEKAGVVPSKDIEVLSKAMGLDKTSQGKPPESTPKLTDAKVRRRSVLDGKRYGPGNRPYWEMKEGQERSCYPNLIRALANESDPSRRRNIWERFWTQTDPRAGGGIVQKGVASQ